MCWYGHIFGSHMKEMLQKMIVTPALKWFPRISLHAIEYFHAKFDRELDLKHKVEKKKDNWSNLLNMKRGTTNYTRE
jgi:hypothetical protein